MTNDIICPLGAEKYPRKASQPLTLLKGFLHFANNKYHEQPLTVQMFNLAHMPRTSNFRTRFARLPPGCSQ